MRSGCSLYSFGLLLKHVFIKGGMKRYFKIVFVVYVLAMMPNKRCDIQKLRLLDQKDTTQQNWSLSLHIWFDSIPWYIPTMYNGKALCLHVLLTIMQILAYCTLSVSFTHCLTHTPDRIQDIFLCKKNIRGTKCSMITLFTESRS
jgi:hypothetical protein